MGSNVRLTFRPQLGRAIGLTEERFVVERAFEAGEHLGDVLTRMAAENPAVATRVYDPVVGRIHSTVQVSVNGRLLSLVGGLEVRLADGDEVLFFYAAGGG